MTTHAYSSIASAYVGYGVVLIINISVVVRSWQEYESQRIETQCEIEALRDSSQHQVEQLKKRLASVEKAYEGSIGEIAQVRELWSFSCQMRFFCDESLGGRITWNGESMRCCKLDAQFIICHKLDAQFISLTKFENYGLRYTFKAYF